MGTSSQSGSGSNFTKPQFLRRTHLVSGVVTGVPVSITATALVPATATLRTLRRSFGSLSPFRRGRRNSSTTSTMKMLPVIAPLSQPGILCIDSFHRTPLAMLQASSLLQLPEAEGFLKGKHRLLKKADPNVSADRKTLLGKGDVFDDGFQSNPHFNRIFKRHVGKSPTQYRESLPKA